MFRPDIGLLCCPWLFALACANEAGPPTLAECEAATAHIIELRVGAAQVPGATTEIMRRHREQLAGAVGDSLAAQCEQTFDRSRLQCVTRAATAEAIDACAEAAR